MGNFKNKRGYIRAKIIKTLHDLPANTYQLNKKLDLNHRTITHHLDILEEMNVLESSGKKYGKIYMLSDRMKNQYSEFTEIMELIK